MTDYSRDRRGSGDEDRLPWLEPVEEEPQEESGIGSRVLLWLAIGLIVVAAIIGAFYWMAGADSASDGEGALIAAPDSYYKERPAEDPSAGEDDGVVYSASKGNEVESVIDTSSAAESPVNIDRPAAPSAPSSVAAAAGSPTAQSKPPAKVAAQPSPAETPSRSAAAAPEAATVSSGSATVQLGAFSSQAKANTAWKNLSRRFSFLAGLNHMIVPVQSGDKTLYRLRASGGDGRDICGRLRTAGESCSVVG